MVSIPLFAVHMPKEVDKPLLSTLHSGYIGQGPMVDEFEKKISKFLKTKNVLTLNSGTSALQLALRLSGVGYGDEVISTPMTCSATNEPIFAQGAKVIWADVDPENGLIDIKDVEKKITKKTKAIICVDWGGTPCDLDRLMAIGRKYNIKIIEDAAHAFGAKYKNKMVGTVADFTCFSLQAIKHITTVDGGLLTTINSKDYKRGKLLRWYGIDREAKVSGDSRIDVDIPEWGYKFHMNDVSATIGIVQMDFIDEILKKHRKNASYYESHIDNSFYIHPKTSWQSSSTYWLYTLVLQSSRLREAFQKYLDKEGVMTSRVHRRNDWYSAFPKDKNLPGVDSFYSKEVCIPVNWKLNREELEYITTLCNKFAKQNS